jgi:hypothetical protein
MAVFKIPTVIFISTAMNRALLRMALLLSASLLRLHPCLLRTDEPPVSMASLERPDKPPVSMASLERPLSQVCKTIQAARPVGWI